MISHITSIQVHDIDLDVLKRLHSKRLVIKVNSYEELEAIALAVKGTNKYISPPNKRYHWERHDISDRCVHIYDNLADWKYATQKFYESSGFSVIPFSDCLKTTQKDLQGLAL